MEGYCDACGRQAQLAEYTRRWFGDADLISHLCSDCLTSIRKRPNRAGERGDPPKPPRRRSVRTEKASNWEKYREAYREKQEREPEEKDDYRPSIVVFLDGKERIRAVGKSPGQQPPVTRLSKQLKCLGSEPKR